MPAVRKGKSVGVDKANQLTVVLNLVFKQPKRQIDLRIRQIGEIDSAQTLVRLLQRDQHGLLYTRRLQAARKTLPATLFDRLEVTLARANDAPELTCDSVGGKFRQIEVKVSLLKMRDEVVR